MREKSVLHIARGHEKRTVGNRFPLKNNGIHGPNQTRIMHGDIYMHDCTMGLAGHEAS
jgi:hypothetical protein